jgi:periplasmic copper chaperone A
MIRLTLPLIAFAATLALTAPVFAHVSLAVPSAAAGSTYKAILQVPHGCDGAATTVIKVRIPAGYFNVKPMAKAGWTIETVRGLYDKPYEQHGSTVTEGVTMITWSGGELPDDFYDEFTFRGTLAADLPEGTILTFPVVQLCGTAEEAWIDVTGDPDAEKPAPVLAITAPAEHRH